MNWINVKEKTPPHHPILVFCNSCQEPHLVNNSDGKWRRTQCCKERGAYFSGESIDFDYWMPLPESPNADCKGCESMENDQLCPKCILEDGCTIWGCKNLALKCLDCGRTVTSYKLKVEGTINESTKI